VRVLLIGLGEDVYELELPYHSLPKLREPIIPADWTRPFPGKRLSARADAEPNADPTPPRVLLSKKLAAQILKQRE
jgi:hypothetical protein